MIEQINLLWQIGEKHKAAELIRRSIAENRDFAGNQVRWARMLALECDWDNVSKLLPPATNALKTSGWLRSLDAGRPIDMNGDPIPWMNYAAIDFIGSKINSRMRVFEWGAGYSSLWFAARVRDVFSAEDNVEWFQELNRQLPGNVKIRCLQNQTEYVNAITNEEGKFDVIVIDGSFRNECAQICTSKLAEDGFVIFDNSDGKEFDKSMEYFNQEGFSRVDFWGLIPAYLYKNCTSILFRGLNLLKNGLPPSRVVPSTGVTCFQAVAAINQAT